MTYIVELPRPEGSELGPLKLRYDNHSEAMEAWDTACESLLSGTTGRLWRNDKIISEYTPYRRGEEK